MEWAPLNEVNEVSLIYQGINYSTGSLLESRKRGSKPFLQEMESLNQVVLPLGSW